MVEARDFVLDELEAVGLVPAAKVGSPVLAPALGESELNAPARNGLLEIGHPQTDVVDAAEG
jgi:hypothetical protein